MALPGTKTIMVLRPSDWERLIEIIRRHPAAHRDLCEAGLLIEEPVEEKTVDQAITGTVGGMV